MSSQIARLVVNTFPDKNKNADLLETFTTREQEILHALAKGYQYKEIADQLSISIETVRTYLRKIYDKLQVHSKVFDRVAGLAAYLQEPVVRDDRVVEFSRGPVTKQDD